jgi:hypothetical protein
MEAEELRALIALQCQVLEELQVTRRDQGIERRIDRIALLKLCDSITRDRIRVIKITLIPSDLQICCHQLMILDIVKS